MSKRILVLFVAIGLATQLSGCTSRGAKEGGEVAVSNDETFAEEGEADFAEGEKASEESPDSLDVADAPADEGEQAVRDDASAGEGGDALAIDEDPGKAPSEELALDEPAPEGANSAKADVAASDTPAPEAAPLAESSPPGDEPLFTSDQTSTPEQAPAAQAAVEPPPPDSGLTEIAPPSAEEAPPAAPPVASFAPYLKVKDVPFTKSGTLLNRVYLARPGDTPKSIARKIYGASSRSKDLVNWNPVLNRGARAGDKIYYNSPKDPADGTRMLTYYEENGIPPMIYSSVEGDNIRRVSKKLLGFGEAWKEVWATNPMIESKGDIPGGLEIRYWTEGAAPPVVAEAPRPPIDQLPPKDPANVAGMGGLPEPPPPPEPPPAMPPQDAPSELAQSLPPSPPPATGAVNEPPPEDPLAPPPTESVAPPPPKAADESVDEGMGTDSDTMMSMAFGAILLVTAVIVFAIVRRNKSKKAQQAMMDLGAQPGVGQDFGQTQV